MSDLNGTIRSTVKGFIKGHSIFRPDIVMVRWSRDFKYELEAIHNFRQETKIKRTGKVKVGFLAQYLPVWNKVEAIYQRLCNDERFNTVVICVSNNLTSSPADNEVYEYFRNLGYSNVINARTNDSWLDLRTLGLDYLFYTRPYNNCIPEAYNSEVVSKYCRICGIEYGCPLPAYNFINAGMNKEFCRNAYFYFAGNDEEKDINQRRFRLSHRLGLQKTLNNGWPFLETFQESRGKKSETWAFSTHSVKVLWTPRWTTDEFVGGSNFLRYYKSFLELMKANNMTDFVVRPHPMMFENFIKTGELSAAEEQMFKSTIDEMPNAYLDYSQEYSATLWESTFLISDYSSLVVQYFTTCKPIIYCITENPQLKYTTMFQKILDTNYVATSFDEIVTLYEQLSKGVDPKKKLRIELCNKLFGESGENSSHDIVNTIWMDSLIHREKQ